MTYWVGGGGGFLSEPLNTKVRFRKTRISEGFFIEPSIRNSLQTPFFRFFRDAESSSLDSLGSASLEISICLRNFLLLAMISFPPFQLGASPPQLFLLQEPDLPAQERAISYAATWPYWMESPSMHFFRNLAYSKYGLSNPMEGLPPNPSTNGFDIGKSASDKVCYIDRTELFRFTILPRSSLPCIRQPLLLYPQPALHCRLIC